MSGKYSSKQDYFIASDLYNLPLPVLPPADLSLTSAVCVPSYLFYRKGSLTKVAGFATNDNAYVRAIGMGSNLADGLVNASVATAPTLGWGFRLQSELFAAGIPAVTNIVNTNSITIASGGTFAQQLAVGMTVMWLDDGYVVRTGVIATIAANGNSLTLTANTTNSGMLTNSTTNKPLYPFIKNAGISIDFAVQTLNNMTSTSFFAWSPSTIYAPRGKVTVVAGGTALSGVGTFFIADYPAGTPIAYLDDTGVRRTGLVSGTPTSDTLLTLTTAALAGTGATNSPVIDMGSFIALKTTIQDTFNAYTITIDPLFGSASRRMSLNVMAEIEYSQSMIGI